MTTRMKNNYVSPKCEVICLQSIEMIAGSGGDCANVSVELQSTENTYDGGSTNWHSKLWGE